MKQLLIRQNGQLVKRISLDKQRIVIGRDRACDIPLRDKTVSSKHLIILISRDGIYIEDLNSTNGTLVNDSAITQATLKHNDVITIGRFNAHCVFQ